MTSSLFLVRAPVTEGEWMDVANASAYAGVSVAALTAALRDGELRSTVAYSRVSAVLVHSHDVEVWAAERESRLLALPAELPSRWPTSLR